MNNEETNDNGGEAAIRIPWDGMTFEREFLPVLLEKAKSFAYRAGSYRKRFDAEEIASAALPILYCRCKSEAATMPPAAFARLCDASIRLSALGGEIGTDAPLDPDLAGRRLGYRPLRPQNAESYAARYNLPPSDRAPDGITPADLQAIRSRLPRAVFGALPDGKRVRAWAWIEARDSGATLEEAARACGKAGSRKAREAFSMRLANALGQRAAAKGFPADYDNGRGRTCATPLATVTPKDESDWRSAVFSGEVILKRGI